MTRARIIADYAGTGASTDLATQAELDAAETAMGFQSVPHIIPGVLYPAVDNIMLDGSTALSASTTGPNSSTVTSSKYGTVQSDGRMYYYTDIKGSKPIKDPRIGAHFGSQRHKFKSIQLLEQETATEGENIYSVDGREWIRGFVNGIDNSFDGTPLKFVGTGNYLEVTGYFSDISLLFKSGPNWDNFTYKIDGGSSVNVNLATTITSPIGSRYVDPASLHNFGLDLTLGIHTIKFDRNGDGYFHGIELIVQDTTSTATKSQIQIPSQNVVSYGKKFALSAATPHYNPFAQSQTGAAVTINSSTTNTAKLTGGWAGTGATYYSSELDTATSLGLTAWVSGGEYFRPVNGGRVVWWINSSGSLKCSVNMMPPAGTAIGGVTGGHNVPTGTHNWATKYQPALHSTTIDNSQAEIAKTFHVREFGNGGANGDATWKDNSNLTSATTNSVAYVMDDGLTSSHATQIGSYSTYDGIGAATGSYIHYYTFIGTGISVRSASNAGLNWYTYGQNLPYGTHTLKIANYHLNGLVLDGIPLIADGTTGNIYTQGELSIHQPKKPPIPEEAVVVADYMLMADFVPTTATGGTDDNRISHISKGVRQCSISRDVFADITDGDSMTFAIATNYEGGFWMYAAAAGSSTAHTWRIPSFATNYVVKGYQMDTRAALYIDTTDKDSASTRNNDTHGSWAHLTNDETLGVQKWGVNGVNGQQAIISAFQFASPIHTSSHYQTFETPFLHELVGGDRNMEQTNLVVTADGKTWDEVTRDTSYIGNMVVSTSTDTTNTSHQTITIFDEWRGVRNTYKNSFNKYFAIAYDRLICLVEGEYKLQAQTIRVNTTTTHEIKINGTAIQRSHGSETNHDTPTTAINIHLKRGDYVQIAGNWYGEHLYSNYQIERV